ncbi:DUF7344 domain-containing protein [Halorussus salinisoli]|uniref:DUF7344 domain-containing protein n=1 Tax=Halorussus salinisoli TaxID=2558242 RepID=UPI0010C24679|nr:hypothetical protein [Halorussus salinisoli]
MAATTNPETMNRNTTFDLLSSPVRREIIVTLHESEAVDWDRLTEAVATAETDTDKDARRQIRIALHHNHLPRLAEAGLVVYDDETVTATTRLDTVADEIARFDGAGEALTQA